MNEEFLDYWKSPASMPFPDSHKDLELWCNNAFLAGAAAMREKAADTCTHMRYATNQYCAAAIRKIEV